jgi:hypothetical protein
MSAIGHYQFHPPLILTTHLYLHLIFNLIGIVVGGGVESNLVHPALRPPMAYCASPG